MRKPKGIGGFNLLLSRYKREAKKKGLNFSLTKDQFKQITQQNCYYCDSLPKQESFTVSRTPTEESKNHSVFTYNGIDRIDNGKGYSIENCLPCCGGCNWMRNRYSQIHFFIKVKRIYEHLNLNQFHEVSGIIRKDKGKQD